MGSIKDAISSGARMGDSPGHVVAARLDAGEENCATLILHVRAAIMPLEPGEVLEVRAYDPSAQLDLRSWCSMTGHGYLGMEDHGEFATYYLRRRASDGEGSGLRELRQR
jgi:tRNA 2-thiouridine synthesizing protein A